jgi:hypothetical protein
MKRHLPNQPSELVEGAIARCWLSDYVSSVIIAQSDQ